MQQAFRYNRAARRDERGVAGAHSASRIATRRPPFDAR